MEYDNLMQIINQLNETNKILQNNIATKDAAITELQQALNDCSNVTTLPAESSLVIVLPSSDELDYNNGKVDKIKRNFYYYTLRQS